MLGNGAHSVNVLLEFSRNELPIAPHTSLHIDKVVRLAESADTLSDLLSLLANALVLLASHCSILLELLQTDGILWRATRTAFLRLAVCSLQSSLPLVKPLLSLACGLLSCPLLCSHWA